MKRLSSRRNSAPPLRPALAGADDGRPVRLVSEADAAALQVVGGHLDDDAVAHARANAELAYLARCIGENLVVIVELHAKIPVGKDLDHLPLEFQQFFLRHRVLRILSAIPDERVASASRRGAA